MKNNINQNDQMDKDTKSMIIYLFSATFSDSTQFPLETYKDYAANFIPTRSQVMNKGEKTILITLGSEDGSQGEKSAHFYMINSFFSFSFH